MKIYIASKLHHAPMLRNLRDAWREDGLIINSRWLDQAQHEATATPDDFKIFWHTDHIDITECNALVLYTTPDDELRGALVEVGMALALAKPVVLAGDNRAFGSWQYHASIVRATGLIHARKMLLRLLPPART